MNEIVDGGGIDYQSAIGIIVGNQGDGIVSCMKVGMAGIVNGIGTAITKPPLIKTGS